MGTTATGGTEPASIVLQHQETFGYTPQVSSKAYRLGESETLSGILQDYSREFRRDLKGEASSV